MTSLMRALESHIDTVARRAATRAGADRELAIRHAAENAALEEIIPRAVIAGTLITVGLAVCVHAATRR